MYCIGVDLLNFLEEKVDLSSLSRFLLTSAAVSTKLPKSTVIISYLTAEMYFASAYLNIERGDGNRHWWIAERSRVSGEWSGNKYCQKPMGDITVALSLLIMQFMIQM